MPTNQWTLFVGTKTRMGTIHIKWALSKGNRVHGVPQSFINQVHIPINHMCRFPTKLCFFSVATSDRPLVIDMAATRQRWSDANQARDGGRKVGVTRRTAVVSETSLQRVFPQVLRGAARDGT